MPGSTKLPSDPVATAETNPSTKKRNERGLPISIFIVLLFAACLLYYAVLTPERFGAFHDDGIYVTTAKALATGQGYRIISLPYEPAQTKYPPFYPFLLSLIWRIYPHFPENLIPMILLSVLATLAFLALTRRYLVSQGYATARQALIVVTLSAINWRMMILATAIYSEMVYAALSVVGLYLAEKYAKQKKGWAAGLVLGVVLGLVFLTRSSGLALLIAVAGYYVLRRQWKRAVLPVSVAGAFVVGWIGWCYFNKTTVEGINVAYYTSYLGHLNQVISDLQLHSNASRLTIFLGIVIENLIGGIVISIPLICSAINYSWVPNLGGPLLLIGFFFALFTLLLIGGGFLRSMSKGFRMLHSYVIASLGLYLFWLPDVSYDRFIMPLLPFLLLFLVREVGMMISVARTGLVSDSRASKKLGGAFIILIVLASISIGLYNYGSGIYWSLASLRKSASRAAEDTENIKWIKANTDPSDVLVCYRDPMYFLYTERRAIRSFPMRAGISWEEEGTALDDLATIIFKLVDESNGRYMILTSTDLELEDQPVLHRKILRKVIERYPQRFVPVFQSSDEWSRIYQIENNAR